MSDTKELQLRLLNGQEKILEAYHKLEAQKWGSVSEKVNSREAEIIFNAMVRWWELEAEFRKRQSKGCIRLMGCEGQVIMCQECTDRHFGRI